MGVSGSGKSSIGKALASELGISFFDADDFHPSANIQKMKSGKPLNDADRWPWLGALREKLEQENSDCVLACSALKESYREKLHSIEYDLKTVVLLCDRETLLARMKKRSHFMPPELLDSQLDTLEIPSYGLHLSTAKRSHQSTLKTIKNYLWN